MKKITFLVLFLGVTSIATVSAGSLCAHKKTPGEKLDEAIDKAKDAKDKAKDNYDEAKDKAKDKLDEAKDKGKDKLDKARDKLKDNLI